MTTLPSATFICTDDELLSLVDELSSEPLLALDTESNSLYAYQSQVCLIQLSTRSQDYIIDPFKIEDMQPFGQLLEDPRIEKIFHAAEYDLICLKRDFGFEVNNFFDTMLAARVCGYRKVGLGNMLKKYFDVKVNKKHQKDNWGIRPLPEASLKYAQMDTHYLPELRDILYEDLEERGRLAEAQEVFSDIPHMNGNSLEPFDPDGFWHIGHPHHLNRQQLAVLRALYFLRDELAQKLNRPHFKVFGNNVMIELAQEMPQSKNHLRDIKGLSPRLIRRSGSEILEAIEAGQDQPLPPRPSNPTPDPVITGRYTTLIDWRKERARERGVDADVIISKHTLWHMAEELPQTPDEMLGFRGLGPWRMQQYGADLLEMLDQFR